MVWPRRVKQGVRTLDRERHVETIPWHLLTLAFGFRLATLGLWAAIIALLGVGCVLLVNLMVSAERFLLAPFIGLLLVGYVVARAAWMLLVPATGTALAVRIDPEQHSDIWEFVTGVAARVGATPPDHIVLGMSGSFHVTQSKTNLVNGPELSGRILHLSSPLMRVIDQDQLKAVLGHEFSHFTGGDTLYSVHIAPVYRSCQQGLATLRNSFDSGSGSGLVWLVMALASIPIMVVIYLYSLGFRVVDNAMSRRRELRADQLAAREFGERTMVSALVRVVGFGVVLDSVSHQQFVSLLAEGKMFRNYSEHFAMSVGAWSDAATEVVSSALNAKTEMFDSHPALNDRLNALRVSVGDVSNVVSQPSDGDVPFRVTALAEKLTELCGAMTASIISGANQDKAASD